ncbi:MAG TPA: acyl-CoA desaturase [Kofleriaceae bacterium]|jgi:fatty acid desaturase
MTDRALVAELGRRLRDAGCFAPCSYARRLAVLVPLFAALFVLATQSLVACVACAIVSVQLGIVSHDAGHAQVSRARWVNAFWGHAGMTFACGLSWSHWCIVHDAHHQHSQDEARDPDMQYAAVFSVYPSADKRGVAALARPFQHVYFWPLGALYSWSLRWDSIARCIRDPARTRVDRLVLPLHYALWLGVPVWLIGPVAALASYVVVSTVIGLYLVAIFAPNHMGMPSLRTGEYTSYLRQQIVTSRDLHGGAWLALLFQGLEHQIEHHLFPRIGQAQLRRARRIVTAFCAEHGLPHASTTFWRAHGEILVHLRRMGGEGHHETTPA